MNMRPRLVMGVAAAALAVIGCGIAAGGRRDTGE